MGQALQERMNKTYSTLLDKQELEPDTTLVKSYLREVHLSEEATNDSVFNLAKDLFSEKQIQKRGEIRVRETEEEFFFLVDGIGRGGEQVTIYLDATNPRFWILHSMNSSILLDDLFDVLVSVTPLFDKTWIPTHLLARMAKFGHLRGLGLDYDRRVLPDVDFEANEKSVEFLKMQLWGNKASEILKVLSQENAFPHESTLSKVKIKHWKQDDDGTEFSIDDIKFDGKITARGTSFQCHLEIIDQIYTDYKKLISEVENKYQLRWLEIEERLVLSGEPLNFIFDRPITDIKLFCSHLFNAADPFRLWGIPSFIGTKFAKIAAVDLHVGSRLNFEITPEYIRVYLPKGSCGNSVIRVYTNLQHYYDALIQVQNGDEQSLFEKF